MDFREQQAIYLQIADYVSENILLKKWPPGQRMISIRDLAVTIEVNPNTVQRSYDFLQQKGIISNRRGIGYFVEEDAEKKIRAYRRELFMANDLPHLFKNLFLLDIPMKDVEAKYKKYIEKHFKKIIHETK
jgi:DNA-binding transcriptional regulator YhcF (GntR family)